MTPISFGEAGSNLREGGFRFFRQMQNVRDLIALCANKTKRLVECIGSRLISK